MANLDYVAGALDTRSMLSFKCHRRDITPVLVLHRKMLVAIQAIATALGCEDKIRSETHMKRSYYCIEIHGRQLLPILRSIVDRLIIRRRHAQILIEYLEHREQMGMRTPYDSKCYQLVDELRNLNVSMDRHV
jgi:hypothetical protein